jgi:nicotinamidase-related amidase
LEIFEGFNKLQIPGFDLIVYDGQAWSHCLLRTVQQGVEQLEKVGRQDLISRMVVLIDATSIIIGFEEATLKAAAELVAKGVRLEATTTFDLEAEIVKLKA